MPTLSYGGRNGETSRLTVDPELVAVRTHSRRSLRGGATELDAMDLVLAFPQAGVEVFRGSADVADVAPALRTEPDVRFAGRVLVDEQSHEPVVYTENVFVKFGDDVPVDRCRAVLQENGLTIKREPGYATNAFFAAALEGIGQEVFTIAQRLLERTDVEYAQPEVVRRLGRRAISPHQWHLAPSVIAGRTVDASANVAAAHATSRGADITIAVIDTGIDIDHEEFSGTGKIVAPRDLTGGDADPRPPVGEHHGTACAGVACAAGRFAASGVAPEARLMPIRMMSQLGSQAEADAFLWAADNGADVISCSWGPEDGDWWKPEDRRHQTRTPLPDSTRLAINYAATKGRNGKGCLIFFAAGNGNESADLDGYASSTDVLAVAACNDRGRRSVYSDRGEAVFCAFPSSDFAVSEEPLTPGIWTTDVSGPDGYNAGGNYTNAFGGTSSACPGAAGVAALVLSRNPALTRPEAVDVLWRSCDRVDTEHGRYGTGGHSPWYGFGRLNAGSAVELAAAAGSRDHGEPHPDLPTVLIAAEQVPTPVR